MNAIKWTRLSCRKFRANLGGAKLQGADLQGAILSSAKAVGRRKGTSLRMSRTQSRNWHVTEAARPRIGAARAAQAPMADHV